LKRTRPIIEPGLGTKGRKDFKKKEGDLCRGEADLGWRLVGRMGRVQWNNKLMVNDRIADSGFRSAIWLLPENELPRALLRQI